MTVLDLRLEVGKFYKTRSGGKVRGYTVDAGGEYPIHGSMLSDGEWVAETWREDGVYLSSGSGKWDIVGPWVARGGVAGLEELREAVERVEWIG